MPMLRCLDLVELLVEYLDGALDPATVTALEAHLADCHGCTAFVNTYRCVVRTIRGLREDPLPDALRQRLVAFLRQYGSA